MAGVFSAVTCLRSCLRSAFLASLESGDSLARVTFLAGLGGVLGVLWLRFVCGRSLGVFLAVRGHACVDLKV